MDDAYRGLELPKIRSAVLSVACFTLIVGSNSFGLWFFETAEAFRWVIFPALVLAPLGLIFGLIGLRNGGDLAKFGTLINGLAVLCLAGFVTLGVSYRVMLISFLILFWGLTALQLMWAWRKSAPPRDASESASYSARDKPDSPPDR